MYWLDWRSCGLFLLLLSGWAQAQSPTCVNTQKTLENMFNAQEIVYEVQDVVNHGQRYRILEVNLDNKQVQHFIETMGAAQGGAFFTLTEEGQLWLMHHQECVFSWHAFYAQQGVMNSQLIFWLGRSSQGAQLWQVAQEIPLTLLYHHLDKEQSHELSIYFWDYSQQAAFEQVLQGYGVERNYLSHCTQHRLCFLFHDGLSITLLWSHYLARDYLVIWAQG